LVDLYLTTSSFAVLADDERAEQERELRELVRGRYTIPVHVQLAWTRVSG